MFEMLTGRVPFNGETTVAIAIKHIQEEMLSPREFVSEIPVSVEQIVFKCCQKSPDRRYQSMGELIVDLKKSLMNPDEDFVKVVDPDEEASTRAISENDMAQIKRQSEHRDSMEKAMRLRTDKEVKRKTKKRYPEEEEDDGFDPKMERLTTALAVAAAVIIGCIVLFLVGRAFGLFEFATSGKDKEDKKETSVEETVLMIRVVGKKLDTVKVELLSLGLTPEIEYQESSQYQEGVVMESSVTEGTLVPLGSNVILTVSSGSEGVEVPDVVGLTEAEAVSGLEQKGFVVAKTESFDQYIKEGSIVTQMPEAESKVPAGTTVTICISKGPENTKVRVPDLIGKDEMEAMSLLVEAGLQMGAVTEVNHEDANLTGKVCYQSYSVGAYVEKDTVIDLQVSLGPILATYKFEGDITAPTPEEDPAYKPGTPVTVTLMADDGTMLFSTQTTSFPVPQQNITGIPINTGYILYQYTNVTETITVTNEDGSVNTIEGSIQNMEFSRPISFVQE